MKILFFIVYVAAAGVQAWPLLMLSMSSAFGGVQDSSIMFNFLYVLLIVSILLFAIGAVTALTTKQMFHAFLIFGPSLGVFLAVLMAFTVFREDSLLVSVPQALFSGGALFLGISAIRDKELLRS